MKFYYLIAILAIVCTVNNVSAQTMTNNKEEDKKLAIDAFKILGIPPTSDERTIKVTYRKLSLQHHPDRKTGDLKSFQLIEDAKSTIDAYFEIYTMDDLKTVRPLPDLPPHAYHKPKPNYQEDFAKDTYEYRNNENYDSFYQRSHKYNSYNHHTEEPYYNEEPSFNKFNVPPKNDGYYEYKAQNKNQGSSNSHFKEQNYKGAEYSKSSNEFNYDSFKNSEGTRMPPNEQFEYGYTIYPDGMILPDLPPFNPNEKPRKPSESVAYRKIKNLYHETFLEHQEQLKSSEETCQSKLYDMLSNARMSNWRNTGVRKAWDNSKKLFNKDGVSNIQDKILTHSTCIKEVKNDSFNVRQYIKNIMMKEYHRKFGKDLTLQYYKVMLSIDEQLFRHYYEQTNLCCDSAFTKTSDFSITLFDVNDLFKDPIISDAFSK